MNKRNFTTVQLSQGEMHIYDLGGVRLHACQTGDPLADEVFLLEKAGQFVVLDRWPPSAGAGRSVPSGSRCRWTASVR